MKNEILILIIVGFLSEVCIPSVSAIATVPDPPVDLQYNHVFGICDNLSWNPPLNDGGAPIIGYKIEYAQNYHLCSAPESSCWMVLVENTGNTDTTYSHVNTGGYVYDYRVSAINLEGVGLPSNFADVPNMPDNIVAERINRTTVNLTWDIPNDNGLLITGYKIEYLLNGIIYTLIENTNSPNTSYTHIGLTSDDYYYYKVYAINAYGISQAIDWSQADNWDSEGTAPGIPTNVNAISLGCRIEISWDPPLDDGGSPITDYVLEYKVSEKNWWPFVIVTETNYTHISNLSHYLICGEIYCYKVAARNSYGLGTFSTIVCAEPYECYEDYDCDGVINIADNCPEDPYPLQTDSDNDSIGDFCDNCEYKYNPDQIDSDGDGKGDACDAPSDYSHDETPGFEAIILILGIILVFYLKRKKRDFSK